MACALFEHAEAELLSLDREILRTAGRDLQENAAVVAALVQLSGRVEETRTVAGRRGDLQFARDFLLQRLQRSVSLSGVSSMYSVIAHVVARLHASKVRSENGAWI